MEGQVMTLVFGASKFNILLTQSGTDAWGVGSLVRFLPDASSAVEMLEVAASDATILSIEEASRTVTVSIGLSFAEGLELGEGAVGNVARVIDSVCFPDGAGCVAGNYTGTRCAWEIQAPPGQQVLLLLQMLDLKPDVDFLYMYDVSDVDTGAQTYEHIMRGGDIFLGPPYTSTAEVRSPLFALTGNSSLVGSEAHSALSNRDFRSPNGGRILLVLNTRGGNGNKLLDTRGRGFEAVFMMLPRLADMMVSDTAFTNLHYAIGFLEFQMADVGRLSLSGDADELFATGNGWLGNMTMAERCFITCSGLVPYFAERQQVHDAPEFLPVWHRRPPREQVGRDEFVGSDLVTEVTEAEIPPAMHYMGYRPEHFVRTGYISRFPPGTFKAVCTSVFVCVRACLKQLISANVSKCQQMSAKLAQPRSRCSGSARQCGVCSRVRLACDMLLSSPFCAPLCCSCSDLSMRSLRAHVRMCV